MLDVNKIKARLNSLSSQNQKSNLIWKPLPGKQEVRIVPYKFDPSNPCLEMLFHYNLSGKTYLSPATFGRPDPIVEFANKLKQSGDKEEWKLARKLEPKLRTFVPVIVRGLEHEGVKFWGFGKQVYQELLSIMSDPDYGDITDLANGRDIVVEFKTAEDTGKSFPETSIRVKPNTKPAVDPNDRTLLEMLTNQPKFQDLFQEPTYDELKAAMDAWLHPEDGDVDVNSVAQHQTQQPVTSESKPEKTSVQSVKNEDVESVFDNLFNTKKSS